MPNPFFQFKQFCIYHDRCAMKVGSDGVLLGAWVNTVDATRILDVGTGSGLIALMMAQRSLATIHAIDIDKDAVLQAQINCNASPWTERLTVFQTDFTQYAINKGLTYDLIVSNPPFFNNSLKNPNALRTLARHTDTLPHADLIDNSMRLLSDVGRIAIILPVSEGLACADYATSKGLFLSRKTWVMPKPDMPPKRLLLELSKSPIHLLEDTITIETEKRNVFTEEYRLLLKDYFLKF
jgi:tRNA1Val (adenine37-N6)-methyltransferase